MSDKGNHGASAAGVVFALQELITTSPLPSLRLRKLSGRRWKGGLDRSSSRGIFSRVRLREQLPSLGGVTENTEAAELNRTAGCDTESSCYRPPSQMQRRRSRMRVIVVSSARIFL